MLIEVRRDETDRWIGTGLNNNQLLTLNMGDLNIENAFKVIQFHIICKIKSKYSFIKLSITDKISWPMSHGCSQNISCDRITRHFSMEFAVNVQDIEACCNTNELKIDISTFDSLLSHSLYCFFIAFTAEFSRISQLDDIIHTFLTSFLSFVPVTCSFCNET